MATPRILLFGAPGAGKSALLNALVLAAPTLKKALIEESQTLQRFQVQPSEKVSGPFSSDVAVLDCSGTSALEMLKAEEPFANSHPMKKPILTADAVVVAVDVSASKEQMNKDFRQCARWLKHLHEYRGRRTDIADLPVYIVLTKCDLLARKDDTLETWKKRLDEAKRQYDENFRKFMKQHGPGFGTIKVKVLATSIKHPVLSDKAAKAAESFGILELFSDCMESALSFQERRQTSQSRLQNVIVGLLGLVVLLVLLVVLLNEFQPPPKGTTLDEKVQLALPKQTATAAERFSGTVKKLRDREKMLTEIATHAEFEHLPRETQKEVTRYRDEISQYLQLYEKSQGVLKLPYFAKNDEELKDLEKNVLAFSLPEAYAKDWDETKLGRRMKHVRGEYEMLAAEQQKEKAWISGQIEENQKLLRAGNRVYGKLLDQDKEAAQEAKAWHQQYQAQLNAKPMTPRDDGVPGVSRILYEDLGKFEPVKTAQKDWKTSKDDLTNISALIQKKLRAGS
jgi:GTPase SAR1 family protein